MDTSKEYIKMCEKAEEIQEEWKPKRGDFYTVVVHGKATDITDIYIDGFPSLPQRFIPLSELYIWLPRQDQLQGMVIKEQGWKLHPRDIKTLLHNICLSIENGLLPFNKAGLYSMEQLWLGFTMKEKYKKAWDGKEWVK